MSSLLFLINLLLGVLTHASCIPAGQEQEEIKKSQQLENPLGLKQNHSY